jgi:hypothetical protein
MQPKEIHIKSEFQIAKGKFIIENVKLKKIGNKKTRSNGPGFKTHINISY